MRSLLPSTKVSMPVDPPMVITRPWVTSKILIEREVDTFTTQFTLGDVLTSLRVQYGLTSTSSAFVGKLESIKIWATGVTPAGAGVTDPFRMQVSFYNPDEGDGYAIMQSGDSGTVTNPAKVGGSYGMINSTRIVSLGTTSKIAAVEITDLPLGAGGFKVHLVVHVVLAWSYATSV